MVLAIFSRHFNAHPLIPDKNGTLRSSETIHQESSNEMYTWCRARNYFRLWAYLFVNWYRSEQWILWARSSNPEEIPILKTTMIVESHWRRLKHDFLHRFNRPRIDLVVWILTSSSIPKGIEQIKAIQSGGFRKVFASWGRSFKRNWKQYQSQDVSPQSLSTYHTNAMRWTCGREAFLVSRFLVCKHLIRCFEKPQDPVKFLGRIRRQRSCPFWIEEQLILRPEFGASGSSHTTSIFEETSMNRDSDSDNCEDSEGQNDEPLAALDDEAPTTYDYPEFQSMMRRAMAIYDEQEARGNKRFVEQFIESNASNQTLVEEIQHRNNRHTMPLTWSRKKHPATMYYN